MIFKKIADGVINHYKKILVIWIVVFSVSAVFAYNANSVVVYEDSEMAPPDIESARADDIMAAQYEQTANSTAIIVLRHGDMRSPQMTTYVLDIEQAIKSETSKQCKGEARIKCFDSITTVYSVYRSVINATAASLGPALYDTESNVTGMAFMIYGLPYIYISTWDAVSGGMNGTAFMVYGLPAGYIQAVDGANQTAYLLYGIPAMYAQAWDGVNGTAMLLHGIPSMYAQAWDGVNGTALMLYGIPSMYSQAYEGVNGTALMLYGVPDMYEQTWANVNQTANLLYGGPAAYLQAWQALSIISNISARNLEAYNQSWTSLNASITDPAQNALVHGYQLSFHQNWNSSFINTSPLYMLNTTPPATRANEMVNATAPGYFDFTSPVNQSQQFMAGILQAFNLTTWGDPIGQNVYTDNMFRTEMQTMIGGFGLSPDQEQQLWAYYGAFYQGWNGSFFNSSLDGSSARDRAEAVVHQVAPGFIDQVLQTPGVDPRTGPLLNATLSTFNATNWNDTTLIDFVANQTFYSTMQAMIGGLGLPPSQEAQLWQFYGGFHSSWKATFQGPNVYATSLARAEGAVRAFAPGFISYVNKTDPLQAGMLQGVLDNLNITTWNSTDRLNSYARLYFSGMLSAMAAEMGVPPDQAQQMLAYFDMFVTEWDDSFKDHKQDGIGSAARAEKATLKAGLPYIEQVTGGDPTQRDFMQGILFGFNGTDWNSTAKISEFARGTFKDGLTATASQNHIPADELKRLNRYFDLFYTQWNASFLLPPLDGYSSLDRADYAAKASAPTFIIETAAGNETIKATMFGALNAFNTTTWDDPNAIDAYAYALVTTNLAKMGNDMGLSKDQLTKANNYVGAFYRSWLDSYNVTHLRNDPLETRAAAVVPRAVANFTKNLTGDEAHFFRDVQAGLTMDDWNQTGKQDDLANAMANERAWTAIDGLLKNMTGSINDTTRKEFKDYYDVFTLDWNWSFSPKSSNYMARTTPSMVRGKAIVDDTAPDFFGFSVPKDEAGRFMRGVWQNLTLKNWSDPGAAHNFTVDFIYARMTIQKGAIEFKKSFFEDIYKLGPHPDPKSVEAFTEYTLRHGTLDTYPLTMPRSIVSQFINDNNDTMIVALGFNQGTGGKYKNIIKKGLAETGKVSRDTAKAEGITDLKVYISGSAPLDIQLNEAVDADINRIDIVTAIVVLVMISLFFRSFVTSTIPLMIIGAAIMVTFAVIFVIGSTFLKIHYMVITLTFTALMGAGVDYCIFIVARYREERLKGKVKEEAIRTAVTWAGESITTSGLAVMIGFGGLSVLSFSMVQGIGIVLPIGIGISILVALTFLPSIMMLVGDGIFWVPKFMRKSRDEREKKIRKQKMREERERRMLESRAPRYDKDGGRIEVDRKRVFYFSSAVDAATKHAWAIVLVALMIALPAVYTVYSLQPSYDTFLGMPNSEAKKGLDAMADGFGRSRGMETKIVVQLTDPIYDNATGTYDAEVLSSIDGLAVRIKALDQVKRVDPSTYSEGSRIDSVDCWSSFGDAWKDQCLASALGKTNRTVVITVTLKEAPFAKNSIEAVRTIRGEIKKARDSDPVLAGAKILVGGATASMTDIENLINTNMQQMRIIVVVAIFILLVIVLGSMLIPATAIVSIGLSISWTLAAAMLLFQFGRGMPLMWLMPIILFVVLMGLGMDYNIFIITRMREEVMNGYSDRVAIRRSVERTGGIVTACGAIMAGAFGSMMLSAMGLLQQFGFALFFAIVLDAFIIRIYVMPAVVVLLKKWNWWAPGPLQRVKRDKLGRVMMRGKAAEEEE